MKSVALNVGANSSTPGGRGPIYEDGTFRFIPITEDDEHEVSAPTYGDLELEDVRPPSAQNEIAHFDPEFPEFNFGQHYTYGDRHSTKMRYLKKLKKGDYLFFYGTCDFEGTQPRRYWINSAWGGYIFGHFRLQQDPVTVDEYRALSPEDQQIFENNAHLRRSSQDDDLLLIVGDETHSCLYNIPTPLSLPREDLKGNKKASYLLSRDDVKIRSGFWYRGPIELGPDTTQILLTAQSNSNYTAIFGPLLQDQPGFEDFVNKLSPPSDFKNLRHFIDDFTDSPEEDCLATFSYIAGGFTLSIPRAIISEERLGVSTIFEAASNEDLHDVLTLAVEEMRNEKKTWYDGHRKYIATRAGQLRPDGEGIEQYQAEVILRAITSCADRVEPSFYEFLRSVDEEEAFAQALRQMKGIYSFGRLGAFDFLEALVQANGYEWLAPYRLRYWYVNNVGPKRGLEHVFGVDDFDSVEEQRRENMLTQLMAYACDREGLSTSEAVFAVESALCNCQK